MYSAPPLAMSPLVRQPDYDVLLERRLDKLSTHIVLVRLLFSQNCPEPEVLPSPLDYEYVHVRQAERIPNGCFQGLPPCEAKVTLIGSDVQPYRL